MQVRLLLVPCVEGTHENGSKLSGLSRASDALIAAGLPDKLSAVGADVAGIERLMLPADQVSGDPITNLGRLNGLIAEAATSNSDVRPMLVGGTCSHLIGMLGGIQATHGPAARIGLLWLDAHGDFNTPRISPSGMLGGMPVAVSAGLCHRRWRELGGMTSPIPTDRILFVDVRNLDPDERTLIDTTDAAVARFGPRGQTDEIATAIQRLADRVDHLYVHIDSDVLDASLQPNHPTAEPEGQEVTSVLAAIRPAFATGKVRAFGVVSINPEGADGEISMRSGTEMIVGGARMWAECSA